ncbi:hypothetical protein [Ruminococcus sp.]|uniref:hypothetical protein n=1 Tax=Ruminococcus sp. TaxID=41978 RepID=UPI003FD81DDD
MRLNNHENMMSHISSVIASTADPTVLSQSDDIPSPIQSMASLIQSNNAATSFLGTICFSYLTLYSIQRTSPTALWMITWKPL